MKDTVISLSNRLLWLGRKLNALEPLELQQRELDAARIELPDGGFRRPFCIHWYGQIYISWPISNEWTQAIVDYVKRERPRGSCNFLRGAIKIAEEHLAKLS